MRAYMPLFYKAFEQGWRAAARRESREEIARQTVDMERCGMIKDDWAQQHGLYDCWYRPGWFVQELANGLWICGPNPAEPGSWTAAELLYVSREDAMRACERRAEAAEQRKAERKKV